MTHFPNVLCSEAILPWYNGEEVSKAVVTQREHTEMYETFQPRHTKISRQ